MRFHNWCAVPLLVAMLQGTPMSAGAGEKITIHPQYDTSSHVRTPFFPHRELRRPRVAIVLSGGGARGIAQIGVIRALEKHGVPVDFIAASSMGAIVGGLYASGYSVAEIESLALGTGWDDILSLTGDIRRRELFVDQKLAGDRSFLAVRFEKFEPVLPSAVSSGQRLTDFLNTQTFQALYHAIPDFDHLKIPFRAVATDLISGNRQVMARGSLAEALRASATVPLLFNPIERDSMQLVDGGLVSNIPVDIAADRGSDVIIVVNTTSGLRTADEMKAPWQTADQIMGIMMKLLNERQLERADIVVTPDVGRHLSSDFRGLEALISAGEAAAEARMPAILGLYGRKQDDLERAADSTGKTLLAATVRFEGGPPPDAWRRAIEKEARDGMLTTRNVREHLESLYAHGDFRDVYAEIVSESGGSQATFVLAANPRLSTVLFEGSKLVPAAELVAVFSPMLGRVVNTGEAEDALEQVLRLYRTRGYSLARIDTVVFDEATGSLRVRVNEGIIHALGVNGGVRTRDAFILREFPLTVGDVFQIDKARKGITNISSTTLFEYVYLEVSYDAGRPVIIIRLKERPSQLVRFGLRADNERKLQGLIDIRDDNFQGSGMELGLTLAGGERNLNAVIEYKARRLFDAYLTFGFAGFYETFDSYLYADAPQTQPNRWARDRVGEYSDIRYGVSLVLNSQLERLGNATLELVLQNVRVKSLDRAEALEDRFRLATVRLGTIIDTKDRDPFPTKGVGFNLSYEFAFEGLGSEISYNSLRVMYETFTTWGGRHTIHPRVTMGFADKTMPFAQQFRLGGQASFFGLKEDDRRGRQLLLLNVEYRYFLPFRILYDAYLRGRYDLGTISSVPEEIKFSTLRHGLGLEVGLDTPVGQATFGVGKSFHLSKDLPENPVQEGPFLFYFMVGYQF